MSRCLKAASWWHILGVCRHAVWVATVIYRNPESVLSKALRIFFREFSAHYLQKNIKSFFLLFKLFIQVSENWIIRDKTETLINGKEKTTFMVSFWIFGNEIVAEILPVSKKSEIYEKRETQIITFFRE